MSIRTEVAARTLTVYLPEVLVVATREQLVAAVAAALREGGVDCVRIDGSSLATLDSVGIGALVRTSRMVCERTGDRPVLVHASADVKQALMETRVIPLLYEVE
ncbi:MAG TPA: STAS domain-containing protein [Longimicrobium sp.]